MARGGSTAISSEWLQTQLHFISKEKNFFFFFPPLVAQSRSICDEVTLPESFLSLPRYEGKDAEVKNELISCRQEHKAG